MEGNNPQPVSKEDRAKAKRDAARKLILSIRTHNIAVRKEAYHEVRRPGRDHSLMFQALDHLLGTLEMKKAVVREVVDEALRFKRRRLAKMLEDYIVELETKEQNGAVCQNCAMRRVRSRRNCTCMGRNIG